MKNNLFRQLVATPAGAGAFLLLAALYFAAALAPFLAPYSVSEQDLTRTYHPPCRLLWKDGRVHVQLYWNKDRTASAYEPVAGQTAPVAFFVPTQKNEKILGFIPCAWRFFSVEHPARIYLLGSDSTGRDVFSRLLYGAQISLSIGLIGICITFFLGICVGGLAGYFGGIFDHAAMRLTEWLMAIPGLYLLLSLRSALSSKFSDSGQIYIMIVLILSLLGWAGTARVIRGLTLSLRNRTFVQASEALGQTPWRILWLHLLPNLFSYLVVSATLSIPGYILGEAALSFLGIGIQEPSSSWGLMLSQAQEMKVFMLNFWWLLTPGAAIVTTVILFNILGDRLRDIVDPKFRMTP